MNKIEQQILEASEAVLRHEAAATAAKNTPHELIAVRRLNRAYAILAERQRVYILNLKADIESRIARL